MESEEVERNPEKNGGLETDRFRLATGAFFTRLVYLHGTGPISVVMGLMAASVVLAFAMDSRFAIVAMMIALLIGPMAMGWLYLNWGMRPEYSFNVAWHTLRVAPSGIRVLLLRPVYEAVKVEEDSEEEPGEKEKLVGWEEGKNMLFETARLGGVLTGGDGITVPVDGGKGMIAVPRSAFKSEESYNEFVKEIRELMASGIKNDTER